MVGEQAQDVAFHAEVIGHHMQALCRADGWPFGVLPYTAFVPLIDPLSGYDLGEVHAFQAREFTGGFYGSSLIHLLARHDAAGLRALLPQDSGELARI